MKKIFILLLLLCSITAFTQEYTFFTPSTRRAKPHEFFDYLNTVPQSTHDSIYKAIKRYKDDGSLYTIAYADSVFHANTKESVYYTTRTYVDTINNQFYNILHKRSKVELNAENKALTEKFNNDKKNRRQLKGSTIDNLTMTDMQGKTYTAEQLRGKVVIIDFWFVTCAACIMEMPDLNKIKEDFGTDEVAYFGITYEEKPKVEKFLSRVKYDYTVVPDSRNLTEQFGIAFYPTTLVIDMKGKVVYTGDFFDLKDKPENIRKLLKKLTSGKKPKIVAGPLEKQD